MAWTEGRWLGLALFVALLVNPAAAFQTPLGALTRTAAAARGGRFASAWNPSSIVSMSLPRPIVSAELESAARAYFLLGNKVKQQLGPTRPEDLESALADDFEFVAPLVGPLTKSAVIDATAGLDLAVAIPNFDARYHDFRADPVDPQRVWATMRVTGTHTGELFFGGLGGVSAKPKDPPVTFYNPPEAVSLKFDGAGRVRQITTGYPLDRRVGNTGGLGGLFGVFEGLGYPLPIFLTRSTGEILGPLLQLLGTPARTPLLPMLEIDAAAALPEERLLALTSALILGNFGTADPSLLADTFSFTGPLVGPLSKDSFVGAYTGVSKILSSLEELDYQYRDVRVCPYDVNRVWFTSSPTALYPPTGKRWISPPECGSAQFDGDGKCVALTGGYIMDRRMGNTQGLGGVYGLSVAVGLPLPTPLWQLYTPVQNFARWQRWVGLTAEPLGRLES